MMEMKRILGILLAVCFLMSVTVAAVSASAPMAKGGKENEKFNKNNNQFGGEQKFNKNNKREEYKRPQYKRVCNTWFTKEWKLVKIEKRGNEFGKMRGHKAEYKWKKVLVPHRVCRMVRVNYGFR